MCENSQDIVAPLKALKSPASRVKGHDVGWHDVYATFRESELIQKLKGSSHGIVITGQKVRVWCKRQCTILKVKSSCIKINPAILDLKHVDGQIDVIFLLCVHRMEIVQESTLRSVCSINEVKVAGTRI
jgi:hypothetical protein